MFNCGGRLSSTRVTPESIKWTYCRHKIDSSTRAAGTGFGVKKQQKPSHKDKKQKQNISFTEDGEEAIQKALRLAGGNAAAPVNEKQASKGRIDIAKVKNWGSGKPEQLDSLQLESFQKGKTGAKPQQNFYVQLTYAVAQAAEEGRINEILYKELPVKGRKELPDVPTWSLRKPRYVQYLVDQHLVHHVIELSIAEALALKQGASPSVAAALDCFSEARGLDRSLEIATDLTNIAASKNDSATASTADKRDDSQGNSLPATEAARSYQQYIRHLGQRAIDGETQQDRDEACLRLIAHAYANHMLLLTKGSKVGRSVADRLNLFKMQAVNTYRSYPFDRMGKDPFEALKRNVSKAGTCLHGDEQKTIMDEAPLAMAHTMQLWESLAHTD